MNKVDKIFLTITLICLIIVSGRNLFSIIKLENRIQTLEQRDPMVIEARHIPYVPIRDIKLLFDLCLKYDVDPALVSRIVWCESRWDYLAENPDSTAKGLFQFIDGTWQETLKRMNEPYDHQLNKKLNLEAGIFLISQGELRHWESSRNCWNKDYEL